MHHLLFQIQYHYQFLQNLVHFDFRFVIHFTWFLLTLIIDLLFIISASFFMDN